MDTLRAVALVRGVPPEELAAQVEANADAAYAIPR
jgi:Tat protein secretion system quality control protein TatD with DNase activity